MRFNKILSAKRFPAVRFTLLMAGFLVSVFASRSVEAFPELTRHGYVSCTACHVAPNGGGALTPYGRGLSRELLSTWGAERESDVGHGLLPKAWGEALENSKLRLGGDARWVQTHRENSTTRSGQFFGMQAHVEAVWDQGPWAVSVAAGKIEDPRSRSEFTFVSQRYYGLVRFLENGNVRAGRFSPAFGLNLADHTLSVRRPTGLGPEVERDNVEVSWIGERHQLFASVTKSASSTPESDREQAAILRYDHIVNERSRLGASFWSGDGGSNDGGTGFERQMYALHSMVNLSKSWFVYGEVDRVERTERRTGGNSLTQSQYGYLRLNYEPVQGLWPLLQYQHERADVNLDSSEANKYGFGINFFPRPHFEILGIWNRVKRPAEWSDEAYLVLHYYL